MAGLVIVCAGGPSSSSLGCVRAVCQRASMLVHKEGFENTRASKKRFERRLGGDMRAMRR